MENQAQIEEKGSEYIRIRPQDVSRVIRLVAHFQQHSLGPIYKNLVIAKALDALEEKLGLETATPTNP